MQRTTKAEPAAVIKRVFDTIDVLSCIQTERYLVPGDLLAILTYWLPTGLSAYLSSSLLAGLPRYLPAIGILGVTQAS